jgi:hypothetical protein
MKAMRYWILTVVLLCVAVTCSAADFEAQTGLNYQAWSSDSDESGDQFYLPVYLRGTMRQLSWQILAGYAYSSGDLDDNGDRSISGLLDTQLNLAYDLPQIAGFDWLVGVDFNLPTGKTDEDPQDLEIMRDPDLSPIVSPGQGFNINPFVNLARRWDSWTFGIGAGYAFQGEYDYSTANRDYDPGDILNVAAETVYDWGSGWQTRLFGQYATFGTDTEGGQDLLERGDILLVGAGAQFQRQVYALGLTVQAILRDKSEYRKASAVGIGTESRNSYGDEWLAEISGQYHLSAKTIGSAALSGLFVEENEFEKSSVFYAGERTKAALTVGFLHELSDKMNLQTQVQGFIMDDDPNWLHPNEDRTYRGWAVSLDLTRRF